MKHAALEGCLSLAPGKSLCGENYREMVLTMPPRESEAFKAAKVEREAAMQAERDARDAGIDVMSRGDLTDRTDRAQALVDRLRVEQEESTYASPHFPDIPNYVAHLRSNDRTDATSSRGFYRRA